MNCVLWLHLLLSCRLSVDPGLARPAGPVCYTAVISRDHGGHIIPDQYVWFVWASLFLIPWAALYLVFPAQRRAMRWASLFTMPFGLTEPLFVPEYWDPPSLFDLAQRTGFDIESLVFCFGIGGVGAVLVNVIWGERPIPMPHAEHASGRHRFHLLALASPVLMFLALYWAPWNPIYPSIIAMLTGAVAAAICRPDLARKSLVGAGLFLAYYVVFLIALEVTATGYVEQYWNIEALSGLTIGPVPVEELSFAVAFGAYWAGMYEHFGWRQLQSD